MNVDARKFENPLQLGGIRTGTIDCPEPVRVALVDTGAGLRFTVALSRGGDIVDAVYNDTPLAYLTPNGLVPPNAARHRGLDWLGGWSGGLVTTCGPRHIGAPAGDDGSLHGTFSNTPAAVTLLENPDPRRGRLAMRLEMTVRDTRMFGPSLEVRRTIACTLGRPEIRIHDEVTNVGDEPSPHHWLYHCNLGFPLLDEGARLVFRGKASLHWSRGPDTGDAWRTEKRLSAPLPQHAGGGERGFVLDVPAGPGGTCHVGLINERRGIGVEMTYEKEQLPRLAHWQHLGPRGSYVVGIEPFYGSLHHAPTDPHPLTAASLAPGEARMYDLTIRVLHTPEELDRLRLHDGPIEA